MKKLILETLTAYRQELFATDSPFDSETVDNALAEKISEAIHSTDDFELAARPLMVYLKNNYHPHHAAIVTSTSAELSKDVKLIKFYS